MREAYRYLMEAYALEGYFALAMQTYDKCREMLARELDIEPSSETINLANSIQSDSLLKPRITREHSHSSLVEPQPSVLTHLPYIGRTAEQQQLINTYYSMTQGQPAVVTVIGEAGIGKTRTVETFLTWVKLQHLAPDIIRGRAFDMGGRLSYQPIIDGLRVRIDEENAPDDLIDDVWLAELSRLLPELRERYADLPPPMTGDPDFIRTRLFEAVAVLTQALAKKNPLVLSLDDIQWADSGTLDLLHYLVNRWVALEIPILLILTIRKEALVSSIALVDWVASLSHDIAVTRIELSMLTAEALHNLVTILNEVTPNSENETSLEEFAHWLYQETRGLPFHLSELLRMLIEQNILLGDQDQIDIVAAFEHIKSIDHFPLPPTMRDIVLNRLDRLSETGRALLIALSVIGHHCRYETLCQISGIETLAGLAGLEELLESRLIHELKTKQLYTFVHDNIREIVYTEAGETRRRIYHQQALVHLADENTSSAEMAFHAYAAQQYDAAFRYSLQAGDEISAIYSLKDAVNHYQAAMALLRDVETTPEERCQLCSNYGRTLELLNDFGKAIEIYQAMQKFAEEIDDSALEMTALIGEGTIRNLLTSFTDVGLAESLGERALSLATKLNDEASKAKIQWHLMNVYRRTERIDEALIAGQHALKLAEKHEQEEELAYILHDLVSLYYTDNDWVTSASMSERVIPLWRTLNNTPMYIETVNNYALLQASIGNNREALQLAREALALGRDIGNQWGQTFSLYVITIVHLQKMEISVALKIAQEALAISYDSDSKGGQVTLSFFIGQLYLSVGAFDKAEQMTEQALQLAKENVRLFMNTLGALALIKMGKGEVEKANQLLKNIVYNPERPDRLQFTIPEKAMGYYALFNQDFATALTLSQNVLATIDSLGITIFAPDFYYLKAKAHIGLGDFEEATSTLHQGLELLRSHNQRWYFPQIASLLASVDEQMGNHDSAALNSSRSTIHY